VVLLIALTVVLDGLDNQMLGLAAPALLHEWSLPRGVLGGIFALGFVGMALGTLGGRADRRHAGAARGAAAGRGGVRLATLATGLPRGLAAGGAQDAGRCRAGGVPGTAAAMIAEFTVARWRSLAVTFGVVCVSIGGILGGVAAAAILPALGWRWLFWCSGAGTLVARCCWCACCRIAGLSGAPSCPACRTGAGLGRLGEDPPAARREEPSRPLTDLLRGDLARSTLGLSTAMLSGMFLVYLMFNWAPTMLAAQGFALRDTSLGLTFYNIGGTTGALLAALAIMGWGRALRCRCWPGWRCWSAPFWLFFRRHAWPAGDDRAGPAGLTGSAAQSAMFALGAHAFPLPLRAGHGADGRGGADRCPGQRLGRFVAGGGKEGFSCAGRSDDRQYAEFSDRARSYPRLARGRTEDLR
jgi:AAHS family 4-hydroxybenzoate transporter-like MFS transporter